MTDQPGRARLRRIRELMISSGELPAGTAVTPLVSRSWERSIVAGVMPQGKLTDGYRLTDAQLARSIDRRQELLALVRPAMNFIHHHTRDATGMVLVTDESAIVLDSLGDSPFLTRAERIALAPGASWEESRRGTNGVGTCLKEERPLVIRGGEHFLERNGFLACAAAPIKGPDGTALGVLDISVTERRYHPHTFGLAIAGARIVENRLFDNRHGRDLRIRFHPEAEAIGTFAEGIAALTDDGWLIGASRAGLAFLGLCAEDLRITPLARVLRIRLEDLLDWNRRRPGEPLLVTLVDGGRLFMRVDPPLQWVRGKPAAASGSRPRDALDELDTGDERLAAAIAKARKIMGQPMRLLLQGEAGVGKEHFARAIHVSDKRRSGMFASMNCSAIPSHLVDEYLFGRAPAATCANLPGCMRQACGGTLYLDAIDCLPRETQTKLAGILQERRFFPSGEQKAVAADFVLISATHRKLGEEVAAGRFDAELYYLINGFALHLPPLRERQDFPAVVAQLLEEAAPGRGVNLEPSIATAFAEYAWPGNLRQLNNALRGACAILEPDATRVGWEHLPDDLVEELRWRTSNHPIQLADTFHQDLRQASQTTVERVIALSRGNMSEAARRLGVSRSTLYRRRQGR